MAVTPITTFRLNGKPKEILENLVEREIYSDKTEAVRMALLDLGKKHNIFNGTDVLKK